ncbi:helix-turn-helix transcriptional regulator [uncultured Eubacterium sp.]|uniref:helix-turn-helix domain-containing protein n=1 Tax=uncultured Eubacterium sp. TaxID=165185 RepID=UPI0032646B9E
MKSFNKNEQKITKQTRDSGRNEELHKTIRDNIFSMLKKRNNSSFAALARDCCLDKDKISRLMNGNQYFYADDLLDIANALGVSMDYLCTGKDTSDENTLRLDGLNERDKALIKTLFMRLASKKN